MDPDPDPRKYGGIWGFSKKTFTAPQILII